MRWNNASREESKERVSSFIGLPREKSSSPFIGWRTWRLSKAMQPERLLSVTTNIIWMSPVMTTTVDNRGKLLPVAPQNKAKLTDNRGDYGVYCYKSVSKLFNLHGIELVSGWGECSGHVIEHEYGYRAQKFVIRELWSQYITDQGREELENFYQCPVHRVNSINLGDVMFERESQLIKEITRG